MAVVFSPRVEPHLATEVDAIRHPFLAQPLQVPVHRRQADLRKSFSYIAIYLICGRMVSHPP
jgi:hypothetical protein